MSKNIRILYTNKEYFFIDLKGNFYIQSSKVLRTEFPKSDGLTYWTKLQNYITDKKLKKRKISVKNFNKLKLKFIGEL